MERRAAGGGRKRKRERGKKRETEGVKKGRDGLVRER